MAPCCADPLPPQPGRNSVTPLTSQNQSEPTAGTQQCQWVLDPGSSPCFPKAWASDASRECDCGAADAGLGIATVTTTMCLAMC